MIMKHILYVFMMIFFLPGCNYLDLVPEDDIETIETIFEKREDADEWLATCYDFIVYPTASVYANVAITGADEFVCGDYLRNTLSWGGLKIADGLQMAQSPYGELWSGTGYYAAIAYCNTFLAKIGQVYNMKEPERKQWISEVKALKAFLYFELMRYYGPIILVPENIDPNSSIAKMQQPRSHVDTCFHAIVNLLDESMENLLPFDQKATNRRGYFSKEAALALKAKVLLYAASPLFNGNADFANFKNRNGEPLFSTTYDPERWKRAALAAEEAIKYCEGHGKSLYKGTDSQTTQLQNTMMDVENSVLSPAFQNVEALFLVKRDEYGDYFKYTLPLLKSNDFLFGYDDQKGCLNPGVKMVEMFYTEHGLPIEADNEWAYADRYKMGKESDAQYTNVVPLNQDVLNLHLRREPRFYACIAADGCKWQLGPTDNKSYNALVVAYRNERFGTTYSSIYNNTPQNLTGYWVKKMTHSTIELPNYKDGLTALGDNPFPVIRMAELYLMKAEAWNEYEGPKVDRTHVYVPLNKVRERAGIADVETAWKVYSNAPEKVDTKEGMREIIRREINIEFAFEGHRFWNLRRWKTASEELNQKQYGWNILGETAQSFYNNFDGPVIVWKKNKFVAPRDYFFPIRSEEIMISGCKQNPGW